MAKYIKLGPKAESFNDPYSELSLAGKEVKVLTPKMENSGRVKVGLNGGHLAVATQNEFDIFMGVKEEELETIDSKYGKTAEELIKYYTKTYEVSTKDLKAFKKFSLEEMVEELDRLES